MTKNIGKIGGPQNMQDHVNEQAKQNKAHIEKGNLKTNSEKEALLKRKLAELAEIIISNDQGLSYKGGFASLCFEQKGNDLTQNKAYFCVGFTDLIDVQEGHADVALKLIREDLMKAYGREPSATVKR